jgi:hypothetical protein
MRNDLVDDMIHLQVLLLSKRYEMHMSTNVVLVLLDCACLFGSMGRALALTFCAVVYVVCRVRGARGGRRNLSFFYAVVVSHAGRQTGHCLVTNHYLRTTTALIKISSRFWS